jgi:hypothetical protein
MSLASMIRTPCIIRREVATGEKDELGNETTKAIETKAVCDLQKQGGFTSESPDQVSDTRWVLYLLPDVTIGLGDAVEVDGEGEFEVYGEPWRARSSITQQVSHIEVALRRTSAPGESPPEGEEP